VSGTDIAKNIHTKLEMFHSVEAEPSPLVALAVKKPIPKKVCTLQSANVSSSFSIHHASGRHVSNMLLTDTKLDSKYTRVTSVITRIEVPSSTEHLFRDNI
jgi:hypothetical protein